MQVEWLMPKVACLLHAWCVCGACMLHACYMMCNTLPACMLCLQVNGTEMPSGNGAEHRIHKHIGKIKKRDERIVVKFEGVGTCGVACARAGMRRWAAAWMMRCVRT